MTGDKYQIARIPDNGMRPRDPRYVITSRRARQASAWAVVVALIGGVAVLSAMLSGLPLLGSVAVLYGLAIALITQRRRKSLAILPRIDDTAALIHQGRIEDAVAELDGLAVESRVVPFQHSVIVYNRGVAHIAEGDPAQAIALFNEVARKGWFTLLNGYYASHLHHGFAAAYLASGQLDMAADAAARAHANLSQAKRPSMLPVDAGILNRQGRFSETLALIHENKEVAFGLLTASQRKQVDLLEAFALWNLDPIGSKARINELINSAAPRRPREFLSMAMSWPEFAEFCDRHEIPWR